MREEIASGKALSTLYRFAGAYLDRYSDLHHTGGPIERLREWIGGDLTEAALSGFVAALNRSDLPTARAIGDIHAEGKTFFAEQVLICGVAELRRLGKPLSEAGREVLRAALASWWEYPEFNSQKLGDDLGPDLEAAVFTSEDEIASFLKDALEPQIIAGNEHISGLYQLSRDDRFRNVAGPLALTWLKEFPQAKPVVQSELIHTAMRRGPIDPLVALARQRVSSPDAAQTGTRALWMGALFVADFENSKDEIRAFCAESADHLWVLRDCLQNEDRRTSYVLSPNQMEFVVDAFATAWSPTDHPLGGSRGDTNPWNASEFIRAMIRALGADTGKEASEALDRLVLSAAATGYRDEIKHARASQRRLRRDTEYQLPSFSEIKIMLAAGLPGTIDDLRAIVVDSVGVVQDYLRNGNTTAWKAYWNGSVPNDEETSRDRLIDNLQGQLARAIAVMPETRMPDEKRADIGVIYNGMGIPIEIKGQWHSKVWSAPSDQLIDLYTKDYRANGRGIYMVLWFGPAKGKNLPAHPDGLQTPKTPDELRQMLVDRLPPAERNHVSVIVLDVSPTKASGA